MAKYSRATWKDLSMTLRPLLDFGLFFNFLIYTQPITVAARSKAWTVFARSYPGIVGSNPSRGIDVSVYSVLVLGSGLAMGGLFVQGVLPNVLD
jgi:hypothetical protein